MHRRKIHRVPKLLLLFKIFGIVLILLAVFFFVKNRDYFSSTISGKGRIAVLLYTSKDSVMAVLDPAGGSLSLYGIPGDLYVEVTKGYGSYRFNSVYKLGELDRKGILLVGSTASNLFGIPIDAVSKLSNDIDLGDGDLKINEVRKFILGVGFLRNVAFSKGSNFGFFRFWWNARNVKPKDTRLVNLKETDSVSDLMLPDGSKAFKFDSFFYDRQEAPAIRDSLVISEGIKAEVMNGSSVSGLGERFSRLLTNFGVTVLSVSNTMSEPSVCRIKYDQKIKDSYTLFRLVKDFSCKFEVYAANDVIKSDITIILGESFEEKN